MRSRLFVAVCGVLVLAGACTGNHTKVLATTKTKAPAKATPQSRTAPKAPPGVPKVMLQAGTAYQNGALVQFCTGSTCRDGSGKQTRSLAANDPLMFIIDTVPTTAQVQLMYAGASTPAETRALHVGSLMVYAPTVRAGTYLVRLDATWQGSRGSWVFSVQIPKSG